tara:strand:- start:2448 stop:2963 length:516 start_codon:yes stop_codon:yes gene_type:complete
MAKNKLILKKYHIRRYKFSDYDEVLNSFFKFQKKADIKTASINFSAIKNRSQKQKELEKFFSSFVKPSDIQYVSVDEELNKIVCFHCFSLVKGGCDFKFVFKNPEYALSSVAIESVRKTMHLFKKKYGPSKMQSYLYKRNNYEKYINFTKKYFNAKECYSNDEFVKVEYEL